VTSAPSRSAGVAGVVVGVDIGGTFTDFVVASAAGLTVHKVPSTRDDPSDAFLTGLRQLAVPAGARFVHGSTVATNAVLERRGAPAALLTTEGFRDVLTLARQTRPRLYDLHPAGPAPLIPEHRCFEVPERVAGDGTVLTPLDEAAVDRALAAARDAGAESLAVVFLFSFTRPEHERRVGELARARGLHVSLSCDVSPEYREYERASTTAANAYVAPLMDRYLGRLQARLDAREWRADRATEPTAGRPAPLQVMQSNGGVISVPTARREAVRTLLSGPAGGVVGAWRIGAAAGYSRLLTFDMGGTSTDVALVDGEPALSLEGLVDGLPIRVPMLDIHTVGAGGGSRVRIDSGGGLRVGPESAGADPGPAAYGRGGPPTVTDANLVLGRLQPRWFLGGRMKLDAAAARAALAEPAAALGRLAVEALAEGVVRIADVQMARALRRVSVERGHDPQDYCLVAFGGGGPLHACALAEEIGARQVLVPRHPGALSALGMLLTDVRKEYSRTVMCPADAGLAALEDVFRELESVAAAELVAEGIPPAAQRLIRRLDARYRGQSYELGISGAALTPECVAAELKDAHQARYGHAPAAPVEVVHVRVAAVGAVPQPALPYEPPTSAICPEPVAEVGVRIGGVALPTPLFRREDLRPGSLLEGPALVVQPDTTCWLPPGWRACVDGWYNVVASRDAAEDTAS
jgi:N-methylhydantoinase A